MSKKQMHKIIAIVLLILTLITSANASSMTEAEENYLNATNLHNEIISHYEKRFDLVVLYSSKGIGSEYNKTLMDISTSFSVLEKTHNKLLEEYPKDKNWSDTAIELNRMAKWLRAYEKDEITNLEFKLREELESQYAVLVNTVSEEVKNKTINPLTLTKAEGFYNRSEEMWTNANVTPEHPVEAIESNYYLLEAIDTLSSATGDIIILNWIQEAERVQKKVEQNISYAKSIGVPNNRIPYALYEDYRGKSEAAKEYLNIKDREKAHNFASQSLKSISTANIELSRAITEREDGIKSHSSKKRVGIILSLVPLIIGLLNFATKSKKEYGDVGETEIGKAKKMLKVLAVITSIGLFYFMVLF